MRASRPESGAVNCFSAKSPQNKSPACKGVHACTSDADGCTNHCLNPRAKSIFLKRPLDQGIDPNRSDHFGFAEFRALQSSDLLPPVQPRHHRCHLVCFTWGEVGKGHAEVRNSLDELFLVPSRQEFLHRLNQGRLSPRQFPTGTQQTYQERRLIPSLCGGGIQ